MQTLIRDLRYAVRMLVAQPAFAMIAVLALGLGIGANTAIFSVINAVLLRPLPFAEPRQLISIWETALNRPGSQFPISHADFVHWKAQNQSFEGIAAFHETGMTLTGVGEPLYLQGAAVSWDLFHLLGVRPQLGRDFLAEDDNPGGCNGTDAAMLSHDLWEQRFGRDPDISGRRITIDDAIFTIVGVMPAGFQFPIQADQVQMWTTLAIDKVSRDGGPAPTEQRGSHFLQGIGRLKPGVTCPQAQAEMDTIAAHLEQQYPDFNNHFGVRLTPEFEELVGDVRPALLVLLAAVGCVLLIACANVANLLLARATSRHKEVAIRAALGAGRSRLVRQLLTESLLLTVIGGSFGLLLAGWGVEVLLRLSPEGIPRLADVGLDGRVLAFTTAITLLTGLLFGLVPAIHSSRHNLSESLKEGGRGATDGGSRNLLRGVLVVTEIAIALVLLVSAGLLIRSFGRLQRIDSGLNPHGVLTLMIGLPVPKYSDRADQFDRQLIARIRSMPGVQAASAVTPLPLGGNSSGVGFEIEGSPAPRGQLPDTNLRVVLPEYFKTVGIRLIEGRDFSDMDDQTRQGVAIVNETFARKHFPGEEAIGKHIKPTISMGKSAAGMREIVGIVADVKHMNLTSAAGSELYVPHAQMAFSTMTVVVRSDSDTRTLVSGVQGAIAALDADLPIHNVRTLDQYLSGSVARPRFNTLLLTLFAGLALVLAVVGLYGVLAYNVAQRTHEVGIRMALGAGRGEVMRLVIGQGMRLALIGILIGLGAALAATRLLSGLLYGVSATDPATFLATAIVLAVVALVAVYVPARRATRVDPMVALRCE